MEQRPLGRTDLEVSAVGLGAARIALPAHERGPRDPVGGQAGLELMRTALEFGCTHVDTADGYGLGASESLIGQFLVSAGQATVSTKIGWNFYNAFVEEGVRRYVRKRLGVDLDREVSSGAPLWFDHGQNFSFEYLEFAATQSLERLGTDTLDVLLLHGPPVQMLRDRNWDTALRKLRAQGKCALYGVSVRHPIEVLVALENGRPDIIQVPVSVHTPVPMRAALAIARRKGVGLVGRELFFGGRLVRHLIREAGTPTDPGRIVRAILHEVLSAGDVDAVIVGCSSVPQVREVFGASVGAGLGAPSLAPLDEAERSWLRASTTRFLAGGSSALPELAGPPPIADIDRVRLVPHGPDA